jgi:hypothetical protein
MTVNGYKEFNDDYSGFVLSSNMFLVSFCESGDLLSQWRGHSQVTDGISIRHQQPQKCGGVLAWEWSVAE